MAAANHWSMSLARMRTRKGAEARARSSRWRRGAAWEKTAAAGSAGANDNEEAAPGREGNSECRGERRNAAETAGKEAAVTQVNVGDARSVLARS